MSRSYRKPYCVPCGDTGSAKKDKRIAARAMRRKQNHVLRVWMTREDEDLIIPPRYECAHNDVWGWNRDGKQRLVSPYPRYRGWWGIYEPLNIEKEIAEHQEWIKTLCRK